MPANSMTTLLAATLAYAISKLRTVSRTLGVVGLALIAATAVGFWKGFKG